MHDAFEGLSQMQQCHADGKRAASVLLLVLLQVAHSLPPVWGATARRTIMDCYQHLQICRRVHWSSQTAIAPSPWLGRNGSFRRQAAQLRW